MSKEVRAKQIILSGMGVEGEVQEKVRTATVGSGVPMWIATRALNSLVEGKKARIFDPSPPASVLGYLRSVYSLWAWAAVGTLAATFLSIYILPSVPPFIYIRYVFGSVSVLFLPGYALIEALYPQKEDLDSLERLALSIGLSLALVPLVGLLLNYTPWGIRLDPILVSLSLLDVALVLVGVARKESYIRLKSRLTGRWG